MRCVRSTRGRLDARMSRMARVSFAMKRLVIPSAAAVAALLVAVVEARTGPEFSFSIFYVLPIMVAVWYGGLRAGVLLAALSAGLWGFVEHTSGDLCSSDYALSFNTLVRFAIFLLIALLLHRLQVSKDLAAKKTLIAQKSFDVISTSQQMTALISRNITVHVSELSRWIAQQKANGKRVPPIIEVTCERLGANLAALTEICFSLQPSTEDHVDIEAFVDTLRTRLDAVNKDGIK